MDIEDCIIEDQGEDDDSLDEYLEEDSRSEFQLTVRDQQQEAYHAIIPKAKEIIDKQNPTEEEIEELIRQMATIKNRKATFVAIAYTLYKKVVLFKQKIPETKIVKTKISLYKTQAVSQKKKQTHKIFFSKRKQKDPQTLTFQSENISTQKNDQTLSHLQDYEKMTVWNSPLKRKSQFEQSQQRYQQKQIVARAFLEKGYGINQLKALIEQVDFPVKIQMPRYKTLSSGMVTDVYRKIEEYLNEVCSMNIPPLESRNLKYLHTILLNSLKNFDPQKVETMKKLVKMTFQLQKLVSFSKLEIVRLYKEIRRYYSIKQEENIAQSATLNAVPRIGHKNPGMAIPLITSSTKTKLKAPENLWTLALEHEIIDIFQKCQSYARIRDLLKVQHSQLNKIWFDIPLVRARIDKMVRQALRRVEAEYKKSPERYPPLIKITDEVIKDIQKAMNSLPIRLQLTRVYKSNDYGADTVTKAINIINETFEQV